MKVQTHHIPTPGLDLAFESQADGFESVRLLADTAACEFVAPVAIELNIVPMPDFFRVKGRLNTTVRQACVRCLEKFEQSLSSGFTLDYSKQIPGDLHRDDQQGIELTAQQIGMIHYQDDEIDFTEAIQEQIVLAVPYRAICKDDCKGLCSRCGRNLNLDDCQCSSQGPGGPFDVLKKLKFPSE